MAEKRSKRVVKKGGGGSEVISLKKASTGKRVGKNANTQQNKRWTLMHLQRKNFKGRLKELKKRGNRGTYDNSRGLQVGKNSKSLGGNWTSEDVLYPIWWGRLGSGLGANVVHGKNLLVSINAGTRKNREKFGR